ncbi:FHA domain-containing protein [Actinomadura rubteroloni]
MCPYCEAVLTNPAAAQCESCLRPLTSKPHGAPQAAPTLRVQFPSGDVKVAAGQHLVLGRDAGQSPVANTFTQYDNVSRRHSTVWLDPSGTAWVRDEGSTNGTFVNGERLPRGVEAPLRDGDQLRLAADVTGTVQLT